MEHSYKPDINEKSAQIASTRRAEADDSRVVEERLISYKDMYLKQRTDKAIEKDELDRSMLSFMPQLPQTSYTPRQDKKSEISKWDELHKQSTTKYGRRDLP